MKAVIFAGGYGSRLSISDSDVPKPLTNIGEMPILWHIMKIYSSFEINDFIVLCGFKGVMIKNFFLNYKSHTSDIEIDLPNDIVKFQPKKSEPWRIQLVDTGVDTMTGGRLKRIKDLVSEDFCLTYGDGVGNIDVANLIQSHKDSNCLVTLTAVKLPGRFGALEMSGTKVTSFKEKSGHAEAWVNGGFFVVSPKALEYIDSDESVWEEEPLRQIANLGQLNAYKHNGFWKPMDSPRDVVELNRIWKSGVAPWKTWTN